MTSILKGHSGHLSGQRICQVKYFNQTFQTFVTNLLEIHIAQTWNKIEMVLGFTSFIGTFLYRQYYKPQIQSSLKNIQCVYVMILDSRRKVKLPFYLFPKVIVLKVIQSLSLCFWDLQEFNSTYSALVSTQNFAFFTSSSLSCAPFLDSSQ